MGRFNPRARRGRDFFFASSYRHEQSFNPRARRGRDNDCISISNVKHVSIHAPAGGATMRVFPDPVSTFCFNPRARRGRDREICC